MGFFKPIWGKILVTISIVVTTWIVLQIIVFAVPGFAVPIEIIAFIPNLIWPSPLHLLDISGPSVDDFTFYTYIIFVFVVDILSLYLISCTIVFLAYRLKKHKH